MTIESFLLSLLFVSGAAARNAGSAQDAPTRMLRLASGDVLWGSIESHDPDGIRFRRLTNGGIVTLSWSFLHPSEEAALRLDLGYTDLRDEEILLAVDRLLLDDGTEVVGVIERRSDDHVYVKRAESVIPVPKRRIVGASSGVQVSALEIYSKDELYQQRAFEQQAELQAQGREGARAHWDLAQFAERLFDYPRALAHYRTALVRDPDYRSEAVRAAVARTEAKAEHQSQIDLLEEADLWRARRRYDRSLELLASFPANYPGSPLLEDCHRLRDRVLRQQERDVRDLVVKRVHHWTVDLARKVPQEVDSYEAAVALLEDGLQERILERVLVDAQRLSPDVSPADVLRFWTERPSDRSRQASYGLGTWLLGEERAVAIPGDEDPEPAASRGSKAAARAELEQRLERYFKNQELARRSKTGQGPDLEDPEVFWKRWRGVEKSQWALAYFVEFSGLFQLQAARLSNCRECGGTGTRHIFFTGGAGEGNVSQDVFVACPHCHTIGRVRRIRYR